MLLLAAAVWQPPRHVDVALAGRPLLATSLVCAAIGLGILIYDHFQPLNLLAVEPGRRDAGRGRRPAGA